MTKRHIITLKTLADFFEKLASPRQKQYEAVRALVVDKLPVEQVAKKYGYKTSTIYSLIRDVKAEKTELFPTVRKGPREKRTPPEYNGRSSNSETRGCRLSISTTASERSATKSLRKPWSAF